MTEADLQEAGRSLPGDVRGVLFEGAWGLGPFHADSLTWLQAPGLVAVAALNGTVTATALALACDVRLATTGTVLRFSGVPGSTDALVRAVGASRAAAWTLTGRDVTAAEALAAGLVFQVVAEDELEAAVESVNAALLRTPRAVATETKALLQGAGRRTAGEQWKAETEAQERVLREE